jgi:hypothetical protein
MLKEAGFSVSEVQRLAEFSQYGKSLDPFLLAKAIVKSEVK